MSTAVCEQNDTSSGIQQPLTFRWIVCYQRSSKMYVGECIDLDIMVKDKRENRAKRQLRDAVVGHVKVAIELNEPGLLRRPAPLSHRVRYQVAGFANALYKVVLGGAHVYEYDASERCYC